MNRLVELNSKEVAAVSGGNFITDWIIGKFNYYTGRTEMMEQITQLKKELNNKGSNLSAINSSYKNLSTTIESEFEEKLVNFYVCINQCYKDTNPK